MTFDECFNKLFPGSRDPIAYHESEQVWNAALDEAIRIANSTAGAESTINNTIVLITTELGALKS